MGLDGEAETSHRFPVSLYITREGVISMAKRKTRQLIVDRLESAASAVNRADDLLAQATALYYERGAKEGALLEEIRKGCDFLEQTIRRFRRERA